MCPFFNIFHSRKNVTKQQIKHFDDILLSQSRNSKEELKNIISSEDAIDVNGNVTYSLVILTKPLTTHQRQTLEEKVMIQHLKITKQIIMLLQLSSGDFRIGNAGSIPKKVMTYLFGVLDDRTNDYLHSVNIVYQV